MQSTKFIVVTGGVLSGLGKGVFSASIGALLKNNLKVVPIKCDGYLNSDTGTMNPIEHGEVFVLDDGGEVDMDFGHYERFIGVKAKKDWNITMGKVYKQILDNERKGKYLGETVQLIPHATDEIKRRIYKIIDEDHPQVVLIEIGGTVGDIENELFIEAIRQIRNEVGRKNSLFIHLTYVPFISGSKEFKSKPTQNSIKLLHQSGIYPDAIICRVTHYLSEQVKKKISQNCDIEENSVFSGIDVENINQLPLYFEKEGMSKLLKNKLKLKVNRLPKLNRELIENLLRLNKLEKKDYISIALCGKYTNLEDSYASINEAIQHCSAYLNVPIKIGFIDSSKIKKGSSYVEVNKFLEGIDGVIVPGGFGTRGTEGMIRIICHLRENKIPFMGICYGLQLAVVEYARNVCGIKKAQSREHGGKIKDPVIEYLPDQKEYIKKGGLGGTMRLGGHNILIIPNTLAYQIYEAGQIRKRFRHRFEVNPAYVNKLKHNKMIFSGTTLDGSIMQIIELKNHPFFIAVQFHPELTSSLENPSKLFLNFISSVIKQKSLLV